MTDLAALTDLIEPHARALGFELVRVRLFGGGGDRTLQVMAERPDTRQLTIDDCTALSHRVSDALDAEEAAGRDPLPEAYRLEVSSPGIDRPLTRARDYRDWAGHEARITLAEKVDGRKQLTGDLVGIDGAGDGAGNEQRVTIDVRGHGPMTVALAQIADAKLLITDRLIAATAPLSTEGADEFVEVPDDGAPTPDNDDINVEDTH